MNKNSQPNANESRRDYGESVIWKGGNKNFEASPLLTVANSIMSSGLTTNKKLLGTWSSISDTALIQAVNDYSPYLWINSDETDYPVALEDFNFVWPSDYPKGIATFNYEAGRDKYNEKAPLYAKIDTLDPKKGPSGYLFTYGLIFAFNACGPKCEVKADVKVIGSIKTHKEKDANLCPGGLHNGDVEHVQIELDDQLKFRSIS